MSATFAGVCVSAMGLACPSGIPLEREQAQSLAQPGPAADTIRFNSFFVDRAPLEIQAGTMDLYLYGLR